MNHLNILVVDDDEETANYVELTLSLHGHQVVIYLTHADVCAYCHQSQPQLIILDLHCWTPYAGWHLFSAIRAQSTTAHIPILLYSSDHDALRSYQAQLCEQGCDVPKKPFLPKELITKTELLTT